MLKNKPEQFKKRILKGSYWKKEVKEMKFDAVVGNPPYQEMLRDDSAARQVFPDFIKNSIALGTEYVSLITPSRWFTSNVKTLVDFRKFAKENSHFISIFDYLNEKEIFENVSIMGGINYFLYSPKYDGPVSFYNCHQSNRELQKRNLFEDGLDVVIRNGKYISIIKKVHTEDFVTFASITTSWDAFGISGSKAKLEAMMSKKPFDGCVEVRCSRNEIRFIARSKLNKNVELIDKWKVFSSRANGAAGMINDKEAVAVTSPVYIGPPNTVCTETSLPFGVFDTETEAKNLKKYMETKFFRFMVGTLKTSQDLYQIVYTYVPMQDFTLKSDINWQKDISEVDVQLYKKYNLCSEEIAYIEATIKPLDENADD